MTPMMPVMALTMNFSNDKIHQTVAEKAKHQQRLKGT